MPNEVTCDWLNLATGIEQLLGDIAPDVKSEMQKAIPKVARKGSKALREEAGSRWNGKTGSKYSKGFTMRQIKAGEEVSAEIGNKTFPGLVHLLEKGHATLNGRRVAGIPHMTPVFENVVVPELEKEVSAGVERALEG